MSSSVPIDRLLLAVAVGASPAAGAAPSFEAGGGIDVVRDLPDARFDPETARFGFGPSVRALGRMALAPGVGLRSTFEVGLEGGHDRVSWTEEGGAITYVSDDHWTLLTATRLALGPELGGPIGGGRRLFGGAAMGLCWVQNWHNFRDATAILVDPSQNAVDNSANIDPYTTALVPAAGLHGGVGLGALGPFAFEVEAGYTVSFLDRATLRKAPDGAGAAREAFGLNVVRIGVAAVVPVGGKAAP